MSIIRIGTSNVIIPGNKKTFPLEFHQTSRLHYYSHLFNTVEINSSFYKIPQPTTYKKWVLEVDENFEFSLKLNKEITHQKNLFFEVSVIKKFMNSASGLVNKKGCLLIQFPGSISLKNFSQVEEIAEIIKNEDSIHDWKKAIEFRNKSWYISETWEMLNHFEMTTVLHDHPKARLMQQCDKANFIYLRLHGPEGDYKGDYTMEFLQSVTCSVKQWVENNKNVYIYFNNTIGNAFNNAKSLQSMLNIQADSYSS